MKPERWNIVAIGGGDVSTGQTIAIDRTLVELSNKQHPNLLFIPTASNDRETYIEGVAATYGSLGCKVDALRLYSDEDPVAKMAWADIVYVGGGNTKSMIALWKSVGLDHLLEAHLDEGKPAGGLSAGAICWFKVGNSDWPQFEGIQGVNTARIDALGFIDLVLCPHCRDEQFRLDEFRAMMKHEIVPGIGLDDCCAIQIKGLEYRFLGCEPEVACHYINQGVERTIVPHQDFRPLSDLTG